MDMKTNAFRAALSVALMVLGGLTALAQDDVEWWYDRNDKANAVAYEVGFYGRDSMEIANLGFEDAGGAYDGTYKAVKGAPGKYEFVFEYSNYDEDGTYKAVKGTFSMSKTKDGLLHIRFDKALKDCIESGKDLALFKKGSELQAKLGSAKPNVLDLFKAVYPYTFDYTVMCAYDFIVKGKSDVQYEDNPAPDHKTVDLANGYISYDTGGDPPSPLECCYWRMTDGELLLALNVMGESPSVPPTYYVQFFVFNASRGTVREVEPASIGFGLPDSDEGDFNVALPKRGRDVTVSYLNEEYEKGKHYTLKWNGKGFAR